MLNRRERTLDIETVNECFHNRLYSLETCKYYVHPENVEWTCFEQTCDFEVKSMFGFESLAEEIAMKQYIKNISKGSELIEYYINELKLKGITTLPIWQEPLSVPGAGDSPQKRSLTVSKSIDKNSQFQLEYDYIHRFVFLKKSCFKIKLI